MRIEDIKTGDSLQGIEPTALVTVVAVVLISTDAIQLVYKTPDGTLKDRLLGRHDEKNIAPATRERPWSFDGDGDAFKLAVEAKRIDLAFLFDPMMAVHTKWPATKRFRRNYSPPHGTWLVIFDEAHKLGAHFFGSKLEKTGRFILAEKLGARTGANTRVAFRAFVGI